MEHRVARADMRDGQMVEVSAGKRKLLVLCSGGEYRAFAARCPHYGAPLADGLLHGQRLLCPWHQSVFEAAGGDLLQPPALQALPSYPVTVRDGEVLVDLPDDAPQTRPMPMAAFDPDADPRTFVVVGGGAVAAAAVAAMREGGYQGRIVLVSAEDRWPYDRPNLSKDYLAGQAGEDWLALRPDGFYDEHGIERRHDTVTALDVATRRMVLAGGGELAANAVLIASGAVPRRLDVPGADLDGVLALRSRDDCDRLRERAAAAAHIVVAGASFIGMEAAASLVHRGADVTVVAPEQVPFATTLGPAGAAVRAAHEAAGTRFRLGRRPAALHGEGSVRSVELDDGERLPADLVLAGIGVRPATAFVQGVTAHDDGGLGVDEQLRLAPCVWAGGDVARYPEAHVGEPVRIEHWRLAMQHGRAAGFAMAGAGAAFDGVPFFWTQHGDLQLGFAGVGPGWTDTVVAGDVAGGDFTVYYCRGEQVRAACGTRDRELDAFAELMAAGRLPAASALRREAVELVSLL